MSNSEPSAAGHEPLADTEATPLEASRLLVGIFVGGASRRMGEPKGLLRTPSGKETLLARALRVSAEALPGSRVVLVGQRPDYEDVPCVALADAALDAGPLGGLVSLLSEAERQGADAVIAIACDMPYFGERLLGRLRSAPQASILAPHLDGRFQPLFARYSCSVLPRFRQALCERRLALQPLLHAEEGTVLLNVDEKERLELRDWDRPEDQHGRENLVRES